MREQTFLDELIATPGDDLTWLALADWLEEDGQSDRAELLRLTRQLRGVARTAEGRPALEARLCELLALGTRPAIPALTNSVGMRFHLIPPGRFWMGSPEDEEDRSDDEHLHEVEITRPFWLGVFPVTQGQYQAVMGKKPSHFCAKGDGKDEVAGLDTDAFPVEQVSWEDAVEFLRRLSKRPEEKQFEHLYRLPSEAEWEYACRGGACSYSPFHFGRALNGRQANCNGNYPYGTDEKGPYLGRPCAAGSYAANAFGLNDLHGNVWEWCADWYGEDYYQHSPAQDPSGPSEGPDRVVRGSSWDRYARYCRSAYRFRFEPTNRNVLLGFRAALVPVSE